MTHWKRILSCVAITSFALLGAACLSGGSSYRPLQPTATSQVDVQALRTATIPTPSATPSSTELPVLPALTSYVVKSGDYPMLIAENAGVPVDERDAWVSEMLALNGVEATNLQIGQKLILPPYGDGTLPTVNTSSDSGAPPAAVLQPVVTQTAVTETPALESTSTGEAGVPFAATPPFVAFTQPTDTPTPTATPPPTATPTPTPTIAPGTRAWLTSSEDTAKYYYCDLDSGWRSIPVDKLLAFDSEQQLLAIWGRFRVKAPDSVC